MSRALSKEAILVSVKIALASLFMTVMISSQAQDTRMLKKLDSVQQLIPAAPDSLKAELYNQSGAICRDLGKYDDALKFLHEAITWGEKTEKPLVRSAAHLSLGYIHLQQGNYLETIKSYQIALQLQEKYGEPKNQARILDHIGSVYRKLKQLSKAEEYFTRALTIRKDLKDLNGLSASYNNLAIICNEKNDFQAALEYYSKALKISEETGALDWQSNQLHNIGVVYQKMNRLQEAYAFFQEARALKEKLKDDAGLCQVFLSLGECCRKMNRLPEAIQYIQKSMALARKLGSVPILAENERVLAEIYSDQNDYRKAYLHFRNFYALNDSILNADNLKTIHELQSRFETARKEHENAMLKKELYIRNQQVDFRKNLIIILSALIATLLLVIILLIYYARIRARSLKQSKTLLEQEKELNLLAEKAQKLEKEQLEERIFAEQEINRTQNEKLEYKNREFSTVTLQLHQKNVTFEKILAELQGLGKSELGRNEEKLEEIRKLIHSSFQAGQEWENVKLHFQEVHPGFFSRLSAMTPSLTQYELKLCAYLRMNLSTKEIAQILSITPAGISKSRQRIRKKIGLSPEEDLVAFLQKI